MHLVIKHTTKYTYPEPAWDSFNQLWLTPVEDFRQSLLYFKLDVEPSAHLATRRDYFGNATHAFHLLAPHKSLSLHTESRVFTNPGPELHPSPFAWAHEDNKTATEYLLSTPRVPLTMDWLGKLGMPLPDADDDLMTFLYDLNGLLFKHFTYSPGATHVDTPLSEFFQTGHGVCQDYAHAMIATLRRLKVPARYVSGYLHTGQGSQSSHAWAEVLFPHIGWVGFDPTNGVQVDELYVKIAHGRDYDDCPPLKGQRCGGGAETLHVEVVVEEHPEQEKATVSA